MATSIGVQESTRDDLERLKREIGAPSLDETVRRLLVEHRELEGRRASDALLDALVEKRTEVREFLRRHGIESLRVFGSALHGDARPDSDLDLLVTFSKGRTPGFIRFGRMERELAGILGVDVDLQTPESVSHHFREQILAEALEFHAEA